MATSRTAPRRTSRSPGKYRDEIIGLLTDDHARVRKAYRQFRKLDEAGDDPQACAAIATQVLDELTVHAALEEELLYPAVRIAVDDGAPIDKAAVEHEMLEVLIAQLRRLDGEDDMFAARFAVLCESTLHHAKQEEAELFPRLARMKLDWERLAQQMRDRRAELTGEMTEGLEDSEAGPGESGGAGLGVDNGAGVRPSRSARQAAPRR